MEESEIRGGGLLPNKVGLAALLRSRVALQHALKMLEELRDTVPPKVLRAAGRLLLLVLIIQPDRDRVVHVVALDAQVERSERELAHRRALLLRLLALRIAPLALERAVPLLARELEARREVVEDRARLREEAAGGQLERGRREVRRVPDLGGVRDRREQRRRCVHLAVGLACVLECEPHVLAAPWDAGPLRRVSVV